MAIDNTQSNAPANMQPYVRALEAKLLAITQALATLGVKV